MNRVFGVVCLSATVCLLSAGCETGPSGGQTNGGDTNVSGTSEQLTGPRIIGPAFINRGGIGIDGISTFQIGDSLSGEQTPGMFLEGKPSCLSTVDGRVRLAINSAGELLALARFAGDCNGPDSYFVQVYADATRLNGTQQPARTAILEDPIESFGFEVEMAIDRARDLLYVSSDAPQGESGPWRIYVYEGTSQSDFDNVVAPIRTIILPENITAFDLALGTDDTLYILGGSVTRVTNISTRDGTLGSDDVDTDSFGAIQDITVDTQDRLWLLRQNPNIAPESPTATLMRMNENFADADVSVLISYAGFPDFLRIDSQGTAYVDAISVDLINEFRIYENIESGSADEEMPPTRTATSLNFEPGTPYILAN